MNLADAMRPQEFDDIVGQTHLTKPDTLFMSLIESGSFDSIMFVGSPGSGKTSMANIVGKKMGLSVYNIHAAVSGAQELKKLSELSRYENIIVFIDEIHRYNKSQQDILLKLIDDRLIKLIGASAENPYFNLVPALRSRSILFNFNPVDGKALTELYNKAIEKIKEIHNVSNVEENGALKVLIETCNGDCRRFLNLLEISALTAKRKDGTLYLSTKDLDSIIPSYNFSDDEYYDVLSAMIKSIRGSDPDAALLWCFKLIKNGVAPEAIYRRLMISASEDIGNAYPEGMIFINASYNSFMNVGVPEGYIILAQAVTYLASVPKSNRSYNGYHKVIDYLKDHDPKVPKHIQQNHEGYKYPFDYGNFVKQDYMTDNQTFYNPSDFGFEKKFQDRLRALWDNKKDYK